MAYELRVPGADEIADFLQPVEAAFASPEPTAEQIDDELLLFERDRAIGVVDEGTWVAGAGAYTFDVTVPGGATLPAAGVTMVGVLPSHRRRGILRQLMAHQLQDVADRGEPVAVLTASETSIYGRFGYGLGTSMARYEIDSDRAAFAVPLDDPGRCRMLRQGDFAKPFAEVYDQWRLTSAGAVGRKPGFWELVARDRPHRRAGGSAMFYVLHEDASGRPDGLCTYRVKENWPDRVASSSVEVSDLFGLTPAVEAALWEFLFNVDLTSMVTALVRPVDDPIRWRLADPRRLRTRALTDWLWVRVLDVERALSARVYSGAGSVVLDVVDGFRPASAGRYELAVAEAGGAGTCQRTSASPDVTLDVRDLGAVYLGGVTFQRLADAGRIDENTPGGLARADALFTTSHLPYCGTMF